MNPNQLPTEDPLINNNKDDHDVNSGDDSDVKPSRRSGRRKIKIEYIEDKNRRHITFSKRKAGIMKKAYELSTLTGTQVLLLVVSETGLVYTFTTVKLQPIVTKPEGKNLIQACLNAPDPVQNDSNENDNTAAYNPGNGQSRVDIDKKPTTVYEDNKVEAIPPPTASTTANTSAPYNNVAAAASTSGAGPYQQQPYGAAPTSGNAAPTMPSMGANNYGHPNYMNPSYQPQPQQQQQQQPQQQQQQQSPQQQQQQQPYMSGAPFYGNQQQQQYMQHPAQQQYWPNNQTSPALRQQEDEKARRSLPPNKK